DKRTKSSGFLCIGLPSHRPVDTQQGYFRGCPPKRHYRDLNATLDFHRVYNPVPPTFLPCFPQLSLHLFLSAQKIDCCFYFIEIVIPIVLTFNKDKPLELLTP